MISVIVPVYNKEKYLERCLTSILSQSYKELEVIIVNDGSTDESLRICEAFSKDKRVRLVNESNRGVSHARNRGIMLATGEWIAFVDADDYPDKDYFSSLLAVSKGYDLVMCGAHVTDLRYKKNQCFFDGDKDFGPEEKRTLFLQLMNGEYSQPDRSAKVTAIGVPWGKLYRTRIIKDNAICFNEALIRMQDNIFNMYCFHYASKIKYIDKPLYNYETEHIEGYFENRYRKGMLKNIHTLLKLRYEFLLENDFLQDNDYREGFINEVLFLLAYALKTDLFHPHNESDKTKKIFRKLGNTKYFRFVSNNIKIKRVSGGTAKLTYFCIRHNLYGILRFTLGRE